LCFIKKNIYAQLSVGELMFINGAQTSELSIPCDF
jgi:hypothetical protein